MCSFNIGPDTVLKWTSSENGLRTLLRVDSKMKRFHTNSRTHEHRMSNLAWHRLKVVCSRIHVRRLILLAVSDYQDVGNVLRFVMNDFKSKKLTSLPTV